MKKWAQSYIVSILVNILPLMQTFLSNQSQHKDLGKMSVSNVNKEIEQINNINGIRVFKIGFINPRGFEKEIENIDFIENIYNI